MPSPAAVLAQRLALDAEGVCRQYLSSGHRNGRYWLVGDVDNNPGRSLFVRLAEPGTPGKWTDAATGQHGDLLDLIRLNRRLTTLRDVLDEARAYLSDVVPPPAPASPVPRNSPAAARRLFSASVPILGTPAAAYLRRRGITARIDWPALRFHPRCYYRGPDTTAPASFPAMIAAVTDVSGLITGVHRTWLTPDGTAKAPVSDPRRALGLREKLAKLKEEIGKLAAYEKQVLASPDQQVSLTDPDSRSMATSGRGSGVVGYNVQVAVETEHHLIVTHEVTNSGSDRAQLASVAKQATI